MLALVSSSTASAIGCCSREKNVSACFIAVLEDLEIGLLEVGDVAPPPSVTVTVSETRSMPPRKRCCWRPRATAAATAAMMTSAGSRSERDRRSRVIAQPPACAPGP